MLLAKLVIKSIMLLLVVLLDMTDIAMITVKLRVPVLNLIAITRKLASAKIT